MAKVNVNNDKKPKLSPKERLRLLIPSPTKGFFQLLLSKIHRNNSKALEAAGISAIEISDKEQADLKQKFDELQEKYDDQTVIQQNEIQTLLITHSQREQALKLKFKQEQYLREIATQELVEEHCKEHNIRSPFLEPALKEPIVQKSCFRFSAITKEMYLSELEAIGIRPNEEQEKMLFSENPATCIQAGAGSGKSTILACRVAFLHLELGIPLHKITVTTFTVESRREFVDKVVSNIRKLKRKEDYIDTSIGRSVVKTFHSLAYKVHKNFGDSRQIIFGDWTPKFESDDGESADIGDLSFLSKAELRAKYAQNKSIPKLSNEMNEVYKRLYSSNEEPLFKQLIDELFLDSIKQNNFNQKAHEPTSIEYYTICEKALSEQLLDDWIMANKQFYEGNLKKYKLVQKERIGSKELYYHFYLKKLNVKIFVSLDTRHYNGEKFDNFSDKKTSLSERLTYRKRLIYYKASTNYLWVESLVELTSLLTRETELMSPQYEKTKSPPYFDYSCVGDFGKKDINDSKFKPIFYQFNQLSQFVYSLGKSLSECNEDMIVDSITEVPHNDFKFFKAAVMFMKALEAHLSNKGVITFEQIFHEYGDDEHPRLNECEFTELAWCEHLLIDEFQDISPNIINFLNNIKRIHTRNTKRGTIMFVGDENQAIYVWRGSSFSYIKRPDEYFPVDGKFSILSLSKNYRSAKNILDHGQKCLQNSDAQLEPARDDASSMESEFLIVREVTDTDSKGKIDYDGLVTALNEEVFSVKPTRDNPIYIIFRSHKLAKNTGHKEWDELFTRLSEQEIIKPLTIHTSKGLEAKSIFLLGDIEPGRWHPLKEAIYRWAEVGTTYAKAQSHEAFCLGYVAITRAENNLYWYLDAKKDKGLAKLFM